MYDDIVDRLAEWADRQDAGDYTMSVALASDLRSAADEIKRHRFTDDASGTA